MRGGHETVGLFTCEDRSHLRKSQVKTEVGGRQSVVWSLFYMIYISIRFIIAHDMYLNGRNQHVRYIMLRLHLLALIIMIIIIIVIILSII